MNATPFNRGDEDFLADSCQSNPLHVTLQEHEHSSPLWCNWRREQKDSQ